MKNQNGHGLETLAVRRATVTDAGKVRYRVYRSPDDFVAVIADNALMAVKLAEIEEPVRIVRDMPNEAVALEAERFEQAAEQERVALATARRELGEMKAELHTPPPLHESFVPMKLRDFEKKRSHARILPLSAMSNWLEQQIKQQEEAKRAAAQPKAPPPLAPAPMPTAAEPVPQEVTLIEPVTAAPPPSPPPAAVTPPPEEGELSPEEVQKLLNG